MRRACALAVAIAATGCGLTMTTGPDPNRRRDQRPVCTESMDAPKKDAIPAVLGFVGIIVGAVFLDVGDEDVEGLGAAILVGGAVTMVAAYASGGIGYFRVKRCKKAIDEFNQSQMQSDPMQPAPYGQPQPAPYGQPHPAPIQPGPPPSP